MTGNIWAEIYSDDGSDFPNIQIGTDSGTIIASNIGVGSFSEVTFVFSIPIHLDKDTKYWVVLNGDYPFEASNFIRWARDTTSPTYTAYSGLNDGSVWGHTFGTSYAQNFKEYYDDTTMSSTSTSSSTSTTSSSTSITTTSFSTSTTSTLTSSSTTTTSISTTTTSLSTTTTSISTSTTSTSTTTIYFEPEALGIEVEDINGEVGS